MDQEIILIDGPGEGKKLRLDQVKQLIYKGHLYWSIPEQPLRFTTNILNTLEEKDERPMLELRKSTEG